MTSPELDSYGCLLDQPLPAEVKKLLTMKASGSSGVPVDTSLTIQREFEEAGATGFTSIVDSLAGSNSTRGQDAGISA